ncbi:STAS domain-containing protein [soil metagenome]
MFRPAAALTVDCARTSLEEGLRAIQAGQLEFDMAEVTTVDSAAVATLLAWQRAAVKQGGVLHLLNLSPSLLTLVSLYDVRDLLSVSG